MDWLINQNTNGNWLLMLQNGSSQGILQVWEESYNIHPNLEPIERGVRLFKSISSTGLKNLYQDHLCKAT